MPINENCRSHVIDFINEIEDKMSRISEAINSIPVQDSPGWGSSVAQSAFDEAQAIEVLSLPDLIKWLGYCRS